LALFLRFKKIFNLYLLQNSSSRFFLKLNLFYYFSLNGKYDIVVYQQVKKQIPVHLNCSLLQCCLPKNALPRMAGFMPLCGTLNVQPCQGEARRRLISVGGLARALKISCWLLDI